MIGDRTRAYGRVLSKMSKWGRSTSSGGNHGTDRRQGQLWAAVVDFVIFLTTYSDGFSSKRVFFLKFFVVKTETSAVLS